MRFTLLIIAAVLLFAANIFVGAVDIDWRQVVAIISGMGGDDDAVRFIVLESRVPMATTALLGGAALAASGLMLQTAFRNPLAGPSVLGINSGASLGVALVMLLMGGSVSVGSVSVGGSVAVLVGAFIGSVAIMALLMFMSAMLRNNLMVLIAGIMVGYLASSVISILNYLATAQGVQGYVMWGMSTFGGVSLGELPWFASLTVCGIVASCLMVKPLNIMLLGPMYAQNLGIDMKRTRNILLLVTGVLTATVTAWCGPVAFIGLAVPHIARLIFRTDNHRTLMPATLLCGAVVALACNLACVCLSTGVVPLNAVTPLVGAPVVVWVLFAKRK